MGTRGFVLEVNPNRLGGMTLSRALIGESPRTLPPQKRSERHECAFTLIELLIVIAIILILIAIALPNFLAAQLRAKVTQVQAELRTLSIGVESYATDYNSAYPIMLGKLRDNPSSPSWDRGGVHNLISLSTPIQYVEGEILRKRDPFYGDEGDHLTYGYVNRDAFRMIHGLPNNHTHHYLLHSLGPDKKKGPNPAAYFGGRWNNADYGRDPPIGFQYKPLFDAWNYNPTNGTLSDGDILRWP